MSQSDEPGSARIPDYPAADQTIQTLSIIITVICLSSCGLYRPCGSILHALLLDVVDFLLPSTPYTAKFRSACVFKWASYLV